MFSTSQLEIIRSHVPQMRDKGYLYYLAIESTYFSRNNYEYCPYDLMILYSKEPIYFYDANDIKFSIEADNIYFGFQSGNYNGGTSVFIPRYGTGNDFNDVLPFVDNYAWVSGNCITEYTSSTLIDVTYQQVTQQTIFTSLDIIVVICLFFTMIMQFIGLHKKT